MRTYPLNQDRTKDLREKLYKFSVLMPSGCREWSKGVTDHHPYGRICIGGMVRYPHRSSYEIHVGPIPDGMEVCHRCDNPPCINPDHLFLGSMSDNQNDKFKKGRSRGGSKLSVAQVASIKAMIRAGGRTSALAQEFDVHEETIRLIKVGRIWKHVS